MAIAFYVPPEYGPPRPAQQNQVAGQHAPIQQFHQQDANNNNINILNGDQHQIQNNNQIVNNPGNNLPGLDFVVSFIQDVLRACSIMSGDNERGSGVVNGRVRNGHNVNQQAQQQAQSTRRRHPAGRVGLRHEQDNQLQPLSPSPTPIIDLIPRSFRSLPDIVTCHAGMSFRYGPSTHPDIIPNTDQHDTSNNERRQPILPLSPTTSSHPMNMDFEVSLKLEMSIGQGDGMSDDGEGDDVPGGLSAEEEFRLAGVRLRQIADSFERSRNQTQQRNQSSTFEVNVVISVAVPAVALMAIGLAYLRRS